MASQQNLFVIALAASSLLQLPVVAWKMPICLQTLAKYLLSSSKARL